MTSFSATVAPRRRSRCRTQVTSPSPPSASPLSPTPSLVPPPEPSIRSRLNLGRRGSQEEPGELLAVTVADPHKVTS
jgi:hypothetical protein